MNSRGRRQRLSNIQEIAESLRQSEDVVSPDLTSAILDAVDAERPFLSLRTRRMVIAGRFALGLAVVAVVGAVALANRWAPTMFEFASRPAPLSAVVSTVQNEGQIKFADLKQQVQTVTVSSGGSSAAPAQVIYSLVAPSAPSGQTFQVRCTMVGPTQPAAEVALRCCSKGDNELACCAYRPLAGIAGLRGVSAPLQSNWKVLSKAGADPMIDDLDPLTLDPALMPR